MARPRLLMLAGIAAIVVGIMLRALLSVSPVTDRPFTVEDFRRKMEFQQREQPMLKLDPSYREYRLAFLFAGSEADVAAIKKTIDDELAATAAVKERGLGGVIEGAAERLAEPDIFLIALGGALLFRSLAFVLGIGFLAGGFHGSFLFTRTVTGLASELFLAAILAGLAWAAAAWLARAVYEGRLRTTP